MIFMFLLKHQTKPIATHGPYLVANTFEYIILIRIYSDIRNISVRIGFVPVFPGAKILNLFGYLTSFYSGSVLPFRNGFSLVLCFGPKHDISPSFETTNATEVVLKTSRIKQIKKFDMPYELIRLSTSS